MNQNSVIQPTAEDGGPAGFRINFGSESGTVSGL